MVQQQLCLLLLLLVGVSIMELLQMLYRLLL
jgi:hypothetical protein